MHISRTKKYVRLSTTTSNTPTGKNDNATTRKWFAMRDLKRANAKNLAYMELAEMNFEVFTPTQTKIYTKNFRKVREERPIITDLLFVRDTKENLDEAVNKIPTLQYRYIRGGKQYEAMTVRDEDMEKFMAIAKSASQPQYYTPEEITPDMIGKEIRIVGGPLNGSTANLMSVQGSRKKQIIVSIPNIIAASITIESEFIEYIG